MLPKTIVWPLQFAGCVVKAYLLVAGAKLGYALMGGGLPGIWGGFVGALLAFLVVGLSVVGLRLLLGRVAAWLVQRTLAELRKAESREAT